MERVIADSAAGKQAQSELKSRNDAIQARLASLRTQFGSEGETLQKSQPAPAAAPAAVTAFQAKVRDFQQRQQSAEADLQKRGNDFQLSRQYVLKQINDATTPIITTVMRERGGDDRARRGRDAPAFGGDRRHRRRHRPARQGAAARLDDGPGRRRRQVSDPSAWADPALAGIDPVGVREIMTLIPHRFPMLLVDRVEDIVRDRSARGIKAVTINEPFFAGHFPGRPIMPGVLIVEALAQTAGVLAILSSLDLEGQRASSSISWRSRMPSSGRPSSPACC